MVLSHTRLCYEVRRNLFGGILIVIRTLACLTLISKGDNVIWAISECWSALFRAFPPVRLRIESFYSQIQAGNAILLRYTIVLPYPLVLLQWESQE